jgi:hypothetical protein
MNENREHWQACRQDRACCMTEVVWNSIALEENLNSFFTHKTNL